MHTSTLNYVMACAAAIVLAVALSACGGGGGGGKPVSMTQQPPQTPASQQQQIQAAIQRAKDAEAQAFSSAARASIQCETVQAACTAAQQAADQAFLAEAAREEAEASTTVRRAEGAAIAAESAANQAEQAAVEAERIAQSEDMTQPPNPPIGGTIPWLLPGTTASAAARSVATTAITTIQNTIDHNLDQSRGFGKDDITGRQSRLCGNLVGCNSYDYDEYIRYWGYWSHPVMSSGITKVQQVDIDNPNIPHEQPTQSRVIGLMDNGYFGIAYSPTHDQGPNDPPLSSDYQAFYVVNDHSHRAIGEFSSGSLQSLSLDGASWSGDALGFSISSETPVFGPATLTFTGESNEHYRRSGWEYAIRFNVAWTNGDSIDLSGNAANNYFSAARFDSDHNTTHHLYGHFAGSSAEEALGVFRTPKYVGSFGASR